eukprot:Nk52_evm6s240 gene=Nk52_evmTU6s240
MFNTLLIRLILLAIVLCTLLSMSTGTSISVEHQVSEYKIGLSFGGTSLFDMPWLSACISVPEAKNGGFNCTRSFKVSPYPSANSSKAIIHYRIITEFIEFCHSPMPANMYSTVSVGNDQMNTNTRIFGWERSCGDNGTSEGTSISSIGYGYVSADVDFPFNFTNSDGVQYRTILEQEGIGNAARLAFDLSCDDSGEDCKPENDRVLLLSASKNSLPLTQLLRTGASRNSEERSSSSVSLPSIFTVVTAMWTCAIALF